MRISLQEKWQMLLQQKKLTATSVASFESIDQASQTAWHQVIHLQ